jgi:hypothetical protein
MTTKQAALDRMVELWNEEAYFREGIDHIVHSPVPCSRETQGQWGTFVARMRPILALALAFICM